MSGIEELPTGPSAGGTFVFGPFSFDSETLELHVDDGVRALEPLPARILGLLLTRAGRLVSREELRQFGWPRLPGVADDSLNTCIAQIREALDDEARAPRWIETLRGRGYRFCGTVARQHGHRAARSPARATAPRATRPTGARPTVRRASGWRRRASIGGLAVAAALVVGGTLASDEARTRPGPLGSLDRLGSAGSVGSVDPEVAAGVAGVHYRMTRALDLPGAMDLADSLVVRHGRAPEAHAVRATVLMFLGRRPEAWAEAGRALALDPEQPEALRVVGNLHMFDAAWPEARTALERSSEGAPEASETWVSLAYLQTILGDFAGAEVALDHAVALDPMSALVLGDAGLLHLWAGRYDAALDACATAVEVEPRAVWAVSCAFDAARLADRADEALAWGRRLPGITALPAAAQVADVLAARARNLEAAIADGRGDPYTLATTYAALGQVEQAARALGNAASRPDFGLLAAAVDPRMAPLRGRTDYESLVRRLGLAGAEPASGA